MAIAEKTMCDVCGKDITDRGDVIIATLHPAVRSRQSVQIELCPQHAKERWDQIKALLKGEPQ